MFTVDYQPIANGVGADVETQAQFLLDLANPAQLGNGFVTGVAQSGQFNKVARQSSVMTAAWANAVSQVLGINVLDDGNVPNLTAELLAMLATFNSSTTGDLKVTLKTVADAGWVMCNDGTIGDAASGGTARANADTAALFALLWNTFTDPICPVLPGGRGANAGADFGAHKTINLTKMLGRALAVAGAGGGLTARGLGTIVGEETHVLTQNELANHVHGVNDAGHNHGVNDPTHLHVVNDPTHSHQADVVIGEGAVPGANQATGGAIQQTGVAATGITINAAATGVTINVAVTGITTAAVGANQGHNTMQPTSFVNVMVKL